MRFPKPFPFLVTALASLAFISPSSTQAATRYWDGGTTDIATNGNTASAGGVGTWNPTLLNWDAGAVPHVAWSNASNDTAVFAGTGAAITVAVPITAGGIALSSAGYTFAGSTVEMAAGSIFKGTGSYPFTGFALATGNTAYRFESTSTTTGGFANASVFTMSTGFAGAGNSVVISGTQPVYLTGTSSYGSGTTVAAGAALGFDTADVTGLPAASVAVGANASILRRGANLNNAFLQRLAPTTNTFTIYANNAGSSSALDLTGFPNASLATWDSPGTQSFAFTGTITPGNSTYRFGGARAGNYVNLNNANSLTGANGLVVTAGKVRLISSNNFTGDTFVNATNAGVLYLCDNLSLQNSAIDTASTGKIDLSGARPPSAAATPVTAPVIGGLKGSTNIATVFNTTYSAVTSLTLNPGAGKSHTYSGVISNGTAGMTLTKSGPGIQVLSGVNTYTGPTTVTQGTLALGQPSLSELATVTVNSGAVLALNFSGESVLRNLVLNGVTQGLGIYNSANGAPFLTGTGSIRVIDPDFDDDGLPNLWELLYTSPASETSLNPGGDLDQDGLTNLQEFQFGTHPINPDTDADGLLDNGNITLTNADARYAAWAAAGIAYSDNGAQRTFRGEIAMGTGRLTADTDADGLRDGVESNTGVWISATNTGTNPTQADSDNDSLRDGLESNSGSYVSATNPGSNPNLPDTDGDGAGDWYEATASFTNPNSTSSKPNIPYPLPAPDGSTGVTNKRVKVYIMSGQSNMVGYGRAGGTEAATLQTITTVERKFPNLVAAGGGFVSRNDVIYRGVIAAIGNGPLTTGFASSSNSFGPELGFGHVMGWYHDEPVLLLKSSQGGRALGWDLLPPGSPQSTLTTNTYAGYGDSPASWVTGSTPVPTAGFYGGYQYDQCFLRKAHWAPAGASIPSVFNVTNVLDNFAAEYPQWAAQGFEIAGFVWWHGWNDGLSFTTAYANRYQQNMAHFIKEIRSYYESLYPGKIVPNAPFVLATAAFDGFNATVQNRITVANAQLAVDGAAGIYPEFAGNVKTMEARGYWRTTGPNLSQNYHYYHNAETYMLTGDALGRGMVQLLASSVPPGSFTAWQAANGNTQTLDQDHDGDGVANGIEWFVGGNTATNGFTALPGAVSSGGSVSVTWSKAARFTGTYGTRFVVETSDTLIGPWVAETLGIHVAITGNNIRYTFPSPLGGRKFARLAVTSP